MPAITPPPPARVRPFSSVSLGGIPRFSGCKRHRPLLTNRPFLLRLTWSESTRKQGAPRGASWRLSPASGGRLRAYRPPTETDYMTFDSFELNPALSKAVKDGGY